MDNYTALPGIMAELEILYKVVEVDQKVFSEKYRTLYQYEVELFKKNRDTYSFLMNGKELVGYVCCMPIAKEVYKKIKAGKLESDLTLSPNEILSYTPARIHNMYLSQIVILPEHRNAHSKKVLMNGMFKTGIKLAKRGVIFGNLVTDAVTPEGKKMAIGFGLKPVATTTRNTTIYAGNINTIAFREALRRIRKTRFREVLRRIRKTRFSEVFHINRKPIQPRM